MPLFVPPFTHLLLLSHLSAIKKYLTKEKLFCEVINNKWCSTFSKTFFYYKKYFDKTFSDNWLRFSFLKVILASYGFLKQNKSKLISKNLISVQVAWVRVDTQTILTIHNNVITRNPRISLSRPSSNQWFLHLQRVLPADRGWYMCQINTDPMIHRSGYFEVQGIDV